MIRGIEECQADVINFEIVFENLTGFLFFQAIVVKYTANMFAEQKVLFYLIII